MKCVARLFAIMSFALAAAAGALAWRFFRGEHARSLPLIIAAPAALIVALVMAGR